MGHKTTYILQTFLDIAGLSQLFTLHIIIGTLLLICSYLVYKIKLKPLKYDWLDLYGSQNRAGRRKLKRYLKKSLVGKSKFR